jgi:hypothetical protein
VLGLSFPSASQTVSLAETNLRAPHDLSAPTYSDKATDFVTIETRIDDERRVAPSRRKRGMTFHKLDLMVEDAILLDGPE